MANAKNDIVSKARRRISRVLAPAEAAPTTPQLSQEERERKAQRAATRKAHLAEMKKLGEDISVPIERQDAALSPELRKIRDSFKVTNLITEDGRVPLIWWTNAPNYGDFLSPWLFGQITRKSVCYAPSGKPGYISTGSILRRAQDDSIVWGSGSFGTEPASELNGKAKYHAVRGPLSRSRLLNVGADVPRVYGDPALLLPLYFNPVVEKEYEVGVIVRWSEKIWRNLAPGPGVKLIDFGTADIAEVTKQILSCKRIVSSSLHGLIVADAYGIPNGWLESDSATGGSRPKGGEFKFYDYFASVDKMRHSQEIEIREDTLTVDNLLAVVDFDDREINFDYDKYLSACPFLERI